MTTQEILEAARGAKAALALADGTSRAQALCSMAAQLCSPDSMTAILSANADDMAAAKGHIDDVVDPANTRAAVVSAIDMLIGKRVSRLPKKHANIPM